MKKEIEVRGPNVEEAIATGLKKLRLTRNEVDVEVLDEGRRAILGIGGRDAFVRLTAVNKSENDQPSTPISKQVRIEQPEIAVEEDIPVQLLEEEAVEIDDDLTEISTDLPNANEAETAISVVSELLDLMRVKAAVTSHVTEPDDLTGKQLPVVEINGDDLGALIGPRGETLDALQYISRLMVGHRTRQRAGFVIDIEGYRERREQALTRLAIRMGDKAVKRGSPVTLEAMPAYERRIIHMALRDSKSVRTESTGEGNRRRVRIYPKK